MSPAPLGSEAVAVMVYWVELLATTGLVLMVTLFIVGATLQEAVAAQLVVPQLPFGTVLAG